MHRCEICRNFLLSQKKIIFSSFHFLACYRRTPLLLCPFTLPSAMRKEGAVSIALSFSSRKLGSREASPLALVIPSSFFFFSRVFCTSKHSNSFLQCTVWQKRSALKKMDVIQGGQETLCHRWIYAWKSTLQLRGSSQYFKGTHRPLRILSGPWRSLHDFENPQTNKRFFTALKGSLWHSEDPCDTLRILATLWGPLPHFENLRNIPRIRTALSVSSYDSEDPWNTSRILTGLRGSSQDFEDPHRTSRILTGLQGSSQNEDPPDDPLSLKDI